MPFDALTTKMCRTASQHDSRDRRSADKAWLALAVINAMNFLEISRFAIGVPIVSKCAAAMLDGTLENGFDAPAQPPNLVVGKLVCRRARIDPCSEKRLIRVDIAKPRNQLLIQQRGFDRAASFRQPPAQFAGMHLQRLGAEPGVRVAVSSQPEHTTKPPRIDQPQLTAADLQYQMRRVRRLHRQSSAHAKVNIKSSPSLQFKNDLFPPPHEIDNLSIGNLSGKVRPRRVDHVGPKHPRPLYNLPNHAPA